MNLLSAVKRKQNNIENEILDITAALYGLESKYSPIEGPVDPMVGGFYEIAVETVRPRKITEAAINGGMETLYRYALEKLNALAETGNWIIETLEG